MMRLVNFKSFWTDGVMNSDRIRSCGRYMAENSALFGQNRVAMVAFTRKTAFYVVNVMK